MACFKLVFQLLLSNYKSQDRHFSCMMLLALKQVPGGQNNLGVLLKCIFVFRGLNTPAYLA